MKVHLNHFHLMTLSLLATTLFHVRAENCGKRPLLHLPLIYGGSDSNEGEWPWHTAVYILEGGDNTSTYQCGGTLLSSSFVLTAAHCTVRFLIPIPADRLILRLGIINLNIHGPHFKEYKVNKILRHGKYNPASHQYDVALLKAADQVVFSDYIQPICLPTGSNIGTFKHGHVVGWGFGDGNQMKTILQKAELGLVDAYTCLSSNAILFNMLLSKDNSNYCAGNRNMTNVCDGDSGGGMFVYNKLDKLWYIRGIINAGARANSAMQTRCDTKQYVTFANVTFFMEWIDTMLDDKKTNLFDLADCGADEHDSSVPEEEKPIYLQYPWMTIQEHNTPNSSVLQTLCSGVLIHPRFVLTIGHCICNACDAVKLISVRLGDYNLATNPDTVSDEVATSTHSIPVAKVILHPLFTMTDYSHNIALIKLSRPAPSGMLNIQPICLPKVQSATSELSVVGWKRGGKIDVLQRDIVQMQAIDSCKMVYSTIKVNLDPKESFICVDNIKDSADNCFSLRSGSSLQYLDSVDGTNRYYLKGLKAYGSSRCSLNLTDVYVDVNYYLKWIKHTVETEIHA